MLTYEEAYDENPTISHGEAITEIKKHSCSVSEFYEDCGEKANYKARDLLNWLGY